MAQFAGSAFLLQHVQRLRNGSDAGLVEGVPERDLLGVLDAVDEERAIEI